MLGLFNRYITRLRTYHPVLGNRELFIAILSFLNGADLFECSQVSFYWRTTILGSPSLEVRLLRFTLKRTNECILELGRVEMPEAARPEFQLSAYPLKSPTLRYPKMVRPAQKWENFKNHFFDYAKTHGFEVKNRSSFSSQEDWEKYQQKFRRFYESYVGHIKELRAPVKQQCPIRQAFAQKYKTLRQGIEEKIHAYANKKTLRPPKAPVDTMVAEYFS